LLGRELGLGDRDLSDVYYTALLRSIGCTSYAYEEALATGDDMNFRNSFAGLDSRSASDVVGRAITRLGAGGRLAGRTRAVAGFVRNAPTLIKGMIGANCEAGARLATRLGMSEAVSAGLAQIHERWDGKGGIGVGGEELRVGARVAVFAHDVTVHVERSTPDEVRSMVQRRAGAAHDPNVARAFLAHSDDLLAAIKPDSVWEAVIEQEPVPRPWLPESRIDEVASAFADFADLKSPFTLGHSSGVSALAAGAARLLDRPDGDVVALRRAGSLHDLGRLSVSNGIWDKPGRLGEGEWERVRLHPYHTERILERSPVLRPLARLAGAHHERLDGSGYHRGDPAALLPLPARVLAAADAYHAMTEPRPHRGALAPADAARELSGEVGTGRLDRDAVRAVLEAAGQRVTLPRQPWPAGLTDREVEVLRLAVRGVPNRRIGAELFISAETVRTHVRHVYEKVGCSSRAALALFAMEHDLVRPGDAGNPPLG
jgi:HD-GYP domain-containing protein (c-di-GMP phosphodiesterase class II)